MIAFFMLKRSRGASILVNAQKVVTVTEDRKGTHVCMTDGVDLHVQESVDEVLRRPQDMVNGK